MSVLFILHHFLVTNVKLNVKCRNIISKETVGLLMAYLIILIQIYKIKADAMILKLQIFLLPCLWEQEYIQKN